MPNRTNRERPGRSTAGQKRHPRTSHKIERETTQEQDAARQERDVERVEIGEPVPQDERTPRASRSNRGETGEDEDLPDDEGGIEGSAPRV